MASDDIYPSPFYALLEGAKTVVLHFQLGQGGSGPDWNEQGELVLGEACEWEEEETAVVSLGGGRYRVAERMFGPFSALRLNWGDEFMAEVLPDDALRMTAVIVPRRFAHVSMLTSGPNFSNENPLADHVHALGGGWETVMGGALTMTVPVENLSELRRLMRKDDLAPGVIGL